MEKPSVEDEIKTCFKCELSFKKNSKGKWYPVSSYAYTVRNSNYYLKYLSLPPVCESCNW